MASAFQSQLLFHHYVNNMHSSNKSRKKAKIFLSLESKNAMKNNPNTNIKRITRDLHHRMDRLTRQGNFNLYSCKQIHKDILMSGLGQNVYLGSKLLSLYATCGSIEEACQVFDKMTERKNVVLWTAMINGYARNGQFEEALELYLEMQSHGINPNGFTLSSVLDACAGLSALEDGMDIHVLLVKCGFHSNVFVGTTLVDMYAKCGRLEDASHVFDKMPERNVVSWSTIIGGFVHNGEAEEAVKYFSRMLEDGVRFSPSILASVLVACTALGALNWAKEIHAQIVKSSLEYDVFLRSALVGMYAQCKRIEDARSVFDRSPEKTVALWSAMITAYSQNECANEALKLFSQMEHKSLKPDPATIVGVLAACADLASLKQGKEIHGYVIRNEFESNVRVGSALVDMYAQCKKLEAASRVFVRTSERNVVLWSTMIGAYAQNGCANKALRLFRQMDHNAVKPDPVTIAGVLPACADLASLKQGKEIHCYVIKHRLESNVHVGSSLVDMYGHCKRLEDARRVFDRTSERNVVLWSALIAAYTQNGFAYEALELFFQMHQNIEAVKPNAYTIAGVLRACGDSGYLKQGKEIHCYILRNKMESNVHVCIDLMDMYAKCGCIDVARQLREKIPERSDIMDCNDYRLWIEWAWQRSF